MEAEGLMANTDALSASMTQGASAIAELAFLDNAASRQRIWLALAKRIGAIIKKKRLQGL
jgi:hypothetical protein